MFFDPASVVDTEIDVIVEDRVADRVQMIGSKAEAVEVVS